jgi:hypothetical protein
MFTYCTQALHLSEHAAYNRIEDARTVRRFPVILDLLVDGSITLTTVCLLAALRHHTIAHPITTRPCLVPDRASRVIHARLRAALERDAHRCAVPSPIVSSTFMACRTKIGASAQCQLVPEPVDRTSDSHSSRAVRLVGAAHDERTTARSCCIT